jgi:protein-tyrosine phosphatase
VVQLSPRASRFTFTLRELARLLDSLIGDPEGLSALPIGLPLAEWLRRAVPVVAAQRGFAVRPDAAEDDDVVDPFRRSQSVYEQSGREIDDALRQIARAVSYIAEARRRYTG